MRQSVWLKSLLVCLKNQNPMIKIKDRHRRLIGMIKDNWPIFIAAVVCMLIMSAGVTISAYLLKPVIDDVFINKDVRMLKLIPVALLIVYFFRAVAMYGQEYLMSYLGHNIIRRLRNTLYNRIQDLPITFFQKGKDRRFDVTYNQ